MGRNVILCAVSTIQPQAVVKTYQYRDEEGRTVQCSGLQTNEAPVKCLMECYRPVDVVLCLTSEEARQPCPQGPCAGKSAYAYFVDAVRAFCTDGRKKPLSVPEFVPIDYRTDNASRSVGALLEQLREGDEVYMDVTGGGRDAMFLMMMAMQMLYYKQIRLAKAVYSDYRTGTVRRWQVETDLFALLKAVEDFTSYGKADKLCRYFGLSGGAGSRNVRLSKAVKKLCTKAEEFSNCLALCRTDGLEETVQDIQKAMRNARSEPQQQPDLQLFLALIPRMQADFVPESDNPGERLLNLIEWCVNHELWLQALALYRENVPQCMFELGILRADETLCGYVRDKLGVKEAPESREWCGCVVYNLSKKQFDSRRFPQAVGVRPDVLEELLADWDALRILRNAAIHNADPDDEKRAGYRALTDALKEGGPAFVTERLMTAVRHLRAAAPR
ncbi:MAG: TM1812 family CRISPR-associated protein [bacterium]|nr:TM1812 family CRISPR-associated protein [bacterium]